jgi:hypothetical protein
LLGHCALSAYNKIMGIREFINRNPMLATGAVGLIVALAIGAIVYQVMASRHHFPEKSPDTFFSTDDGKSFFTASSDNVAPFEYKGKTAVHAYAFQKNGIKFVGMLERYMPDARSAILAGKRTPEIERFGREIKLPGDATWVRTGDMAAEAKVQNAIHGPDGSKDGFEALEP